MTAPVFTGVGVALLTLFSDDQEVDVAATSAHAARLVELGVGAVVVAGSTGEAPALSADERLALLDGVRSAVPDTIPVLAGTGAAATRTAVALTRAALEHGADGVLCLSPPGVTDPRSYYRAVAESAGEAPVLAYHFPAVSPPGIAVDLLPQLPVAGLKDSSADPERLLETLQCFPGHVYTGSSALLSFAGPLGCTGAILALANRAPETCVAAFGGDADAQRRLTTEHLASRRGFPVGLKQLVAERFGTSTVARLG